MVDFTPIVLSDEYILNVATRIRERQKSRDRDQTQFAKPHLGPLSRNIIDIPKQSEFIQCESFRDLKDKLLILVVNAFWKVHDNTDGSSKELSIDPASTFFYCEPKYTNLVIEWFDHGDEWLVTRDGNLMIITTESREFVCFYEYNKINQKDKFSIILKLVKPI